MSLFVVGMIAGIGVLVGLTVTLAEQVRVEVRRRRAAVCEAESAVPDVRLAGPHFAVGSTTAKTSREQVSSVSPEARAAAYRQILDSLGNDLDQDITEWEAVLNEFPQVLLADELLASEDQPSPQVSELTCLDRLSAEEQTPAPKRSRRIEPEERGQIIRLSNTGFAPEEIALWLNLPLERVQELLSRP